MKSSSNLDHAKVKGKYRRPLFDIPDEPRVDGVVTPERKRSKIDEPGPSTDEETNARPIKETLTVSTACLETRGNKPGLKQLTGLSNFDDDDFELAEFMSGISSYNSACTEMKNQECSQLGVKIHEETSNKMHEKENDDIKDSKIPVMNVADKAIQQVNYDAKSVDKNRQLNTAADINTGHISNEIKNECETKDANVELFYGLPAHVGSLIKKCKGIEKLYGKLLLFEQVLSFLNLNPNLNVLSPSQSQNNSVMQDECICLRPLAFILFKS